MGECIAARQKQSGRQCEIPQGVEMVCEVALSALSEALCRQKAAAAEGRLAT